MSSTCTSIIDILRYIQEAHRPVSTAELADRFEITHDKVNTKCRILAKQGYLEHPNPVTWVATGTTPNCVLCHGPVTPWFFITLRNGAKVCESCIFEAMHSEEVKG